MEEDYYENQEFEQEEQEYDQDQQQEYEQDGEELEQHYEHQEESGYYDDGAVVEGGENGGDYFEPMWVRAIYDYEPAEESEIAFKENDIVCITADYNDGWWCGDLNGLVGRVPANYFEYLENNDYSQQNEAGDTSYSSLPSHDDVDAHDDADAHDDDDERKEKMRQKREMFKREMKELQDTLKSQEQVKDVLGGELERMERQKEAMEDQVRVMKLLRYVNLEIIKTESDIDIDSDISMHSRQMGIALTQDLRQLRTILGGIKSSSVDQPKKQFDVRLEEIEKKLAANLNNLDVCDNLKKSVQMDLALFQAELEALLVTDRAQSLPLPPPPNITLPSPGPSAFNLPPPPVQVVGGPPPAFMTAPTTVLLSDKDKRKSMKEAKKLEKLETKEKEKEKKKEKKDDSVWKPSKVTK
eukprot:gene16716-19870_t